MTTTTTTAVDFLWTRLLAAKSAAVDLLALTPLDHPGRAEVERLHALVGNATRMAGDLDPDLGVDLDADADATATFGHRGDAYRATYA